MDNVSTYPGISAVERDTGISKDLLRKWESRYGFPTPLRDENDDRIYPPDQVEKLHLINRLMSFGWRPGKILGLSIETLNELVNLHAAKVRPAGDWQPYIECIKRCELEEFRHLISKQLVSTGLREFVIATMVPLVQEVGNAWMRGELSIHDEHWFTDQIQNLFRHIIQTATAPLGPPRVLLTTLPGELHGLGLLMVETLLPLEGANAVSLGVSTPIEEIVAAAERYKADAVALSVSEAYGKRKAENSLRQLRQKLPESIELWVGGEGARVLEARLKDVYFQLNLETLGDVIRNWRSRHMQDDH